MKKFICYFENKITFEIDNYANHDENYKRLIVRQTNGNWFAFVVIHFNEMFGDKMPIEKVYKNGFIKFDRFEIIECGN